MSARWIAAAVVFAFTAAGFAQPPEVKKQDPKPAETKRYTGVLPSYWRMLGLTDAQVQEVYRIQTVHKEEIEALEAKIELLKDKMVKERLEVLTAEQKKRLEDIYKEKSGIGGKEK